MSEFSVPEVGLGEEVLWFPDPQNMQSPHMARVVRIEAKAVCVEVTQHNSLSRFYRWDVRHADDPILKDNEELRRNGCWKEGPMRVRIQELERQVAHLTQRLESLELELGTVSAATAA